jgi:hypothetical protein
MNWTHTDESLNQYHEVADAGVSDDGVTHFCFNCRKPIRRIVPVSVDTRMNPKLYASLITESGQQLALGLATMANLVQQYSNDESNPNVSAWLNSGAIEGIAKVERDARIKALDEVQQRLNEWRKDPWNPKYGAAGFSGVIESLRND